MTITIDVFSILSGGLFSTTDSTIIAGSPPAATGSSFAKLLNRLASISHISDGTTFDDYGQPVASSTTVTDNVKCRLDEQMNRFVQDGKVLNVKEYIGFFLPNTDIYINDTITIESKSYKVRNIDTIYKRRKKHHLECTMDYMEIQ